MGDFGAYLGGILGLIVLILDLIAIFEILRSGRSVIEKLLWILAIVFFPVLGCIFYYFCSNRERYNNRGAPITA